MTHQVNQSREPEPSGADKSDQLSPGHALQESVGSSGSQRIGDNGPVANPIVSFPQDPAEETTTKAADGS